MEKVWKCSFCGDKITEFDSGASICRNVNVVQVMDKTQNDLMDDTQEHPIIICPECLFQLSKSISKIDFTWFEQNEAK